MIENITIKGIIDEDFVNYKVPSMVLEFPYCTFKCGKKYCQNADIVTDKTIEVSIRSLCERYINNGITEAIVCQGMEPMDSFDELIEFVSVMRNEFKVDDDIVIYTGYYQSELKKKKYYDILKQFRNIVVKFGRYKPNRKSHYDSVLGVNLASDNQYARRIS